MQSPLRGCCFQRNSLHLKKLKWTNRFVHENNSSQEFLFNLITLFGIVEERIADLQGVLIQMHTLKFIIANSEMKHYWGFKRATGASNLV